MKKNIWIIDDDQSILEVIKLLLEQKEERYAVTSLSSALAFEEKLRSAKPDLVILDIHINGADGREVAKKLKAEDKTKAIPLLVMTADVHIEEKAKEANADGYVKKPFAIEELMKTITTFLPTK